MDCNNYSYAPSMARDDESVFASYRRELDEMTLALEQWGTGRNKSQFVISGLGFFGTDDFLDISENIPCDCSGGWDTMKSSYVKAAEIFNKYVPEDERIALF